MNKRFPELRLCELDWKADQLATEMYPAWRTHWKAKIDRALASQRLRLPRLRSELALVSNSIHLFQHYISPSYSTPDYLLLALRTIKTALLVKSESTGPSLSADTGNYSQITNATLNQIKPFV